MDFVHDVNGTMGHGAITGVQTRDHYKRSQKKSALSHKHIHVISYTNLTTYKLQEKL